jgi:hypothetical protein
MSRLARIVVPILGLTVLTGACSDDTGGAEQTTSAVGASSATTATSTTLPAPVEIPEAGIVKFQPDTTYVTSRFWKPVAFTVDEGDSWWARGVGEIWFYAEYHDGGGSTFDLDLSVLAHAHAAPVDDLAASIIDREVDWYYPPEPGEEAAQVLSAPRPTTVSGFPAQVFDIALAADRGDGLNEGFGNSRFSAVVPSLGLVTVDAPGRSLRFGVRNGRAARVWIVDVDGSTIIIIAATTTPEMFDELIPAAEKLVVGMTFQP